MLADTGHRQRIQSGTKRNPIIAVWDLLGEVQHFQHWELGEIALITRPPAAVEVIRRTPRIHPVILPPAVIQNVHDAHSCNRSLPELGWPESPGSERTNERDTC